MSDGITITLGEWQTLRTVSLSGGKWAATAADIDRCDEDGCPECNDLRHLEHIGLVDIHDDGSVSLTPEGRLTLYPNP